jgi:hypothetical protein
LRDTVLLQLTGSVLQTEIFSTIYEPSQSAFDIRLSMQRLQAGAGCSCACGLAVAPQGAPGRRWALMPKLQRPILAPVPGLFEKLHWQLLTC